ncbi:hypothetical protein RhiirA1_476297 [Rhizophagus irregularis]|uniref:Uncharacterized protein n=1 Tax=Rhizophagus irregularis TaxID=588596 RepID=A0A2N0QVD5_9GLOM|nr:hypothetical protein RhiirA1_476297 [Rhizophagus irregularis]
MRYFKEILHLKKSVVKEENRKKIRKFQKIEKIVDTKGFVKKYSDIEKLKSSDDVKESSSNDGDKHIKKIYINYWLENEYPLCNKITLTKEAVEYDKEFEGTVCKSYFKREERNDSKTKSRIEKIQKICKIKNKNELEGVIKEILDEYLRKQTKIEENDGEEDNTDDSEKIGEILSSREYEMWDKNDVKDIDEDELENKIENIINTESFNLSQDSDSNNLLNIKDSNNEKDSNSESEKSDFNNERGTISLPLFYEKEEKDVSDWVGQFKVAFTAIGKAPEANCTRQVVYAVTCLRGAAA